MSIVCVGIDLAKNVFALHGVNATGAVQLRQPKVARARLREVVAALPPCTIGIQACSGLRTQSRIVAHEECPVTRGDAVVGFDRLREDRARDRASRRRRRGRSRRRCAREHAERDVAQAAVSGEQGASRVARARLLGEPLPFAAGRSPDQQAVTCGSPGSRPRASTRPGRDPS